MKKLIKQFEKSEISKQHFIQKMYDYVDVLYEVMDRIPQTEISEVRINSSEVVFYHCEGFKLLGMRNEPRCSPHEIITFGKYESFESLLIKKLTIDARFVLDIGANIGHFTTQILFHNKQARVVSFEPVDKFREVLKKNLKLNNLNKRCQIEPVALSSESGIENFFIPFRNGTNASLKNVSNSEDFKIISVNKTTLDSYNFEEVDFIKIDVEGAEFEVLKGSLTLLKNNEPIIFIELLRKWSREFNYHPNDVINLLKINGYRCFGIDEGYLVEMIEVNDFTKQTNFLFCTDSKSDKLLDYVR